MRKRCAVFFLGCFFALLIAAGAANADTIGPLTSSISSTATDWNNTLSFNQFNPSLGTLNSVTLGLSGSSTMTVTFNAIPGRYGSITDPGVTVIFNVNTTNSLFSTPQISLSLTSTGSYTTSTQGGSLVFNLGTTSGPYSNTYTTSNVLAYFTGTGSAILDASTGTYWNGSYISNMANENTNGTTAGLTGQITYNYTPNPVPVPSAVLLLGPGLIGLALIRKRLKR